LAVISATSSLDQKVQPRPAVELVPQALCGCQGEGVLRCGAAAHDGVYCGLAGGKALEGGVPVERIMQQCTGNEFVQGQRAGAAGDGKPVCGQAPTGVERTPIGGDGLAAQQLTALLRRAGIRRASGLLIILFGLWSLPGPHQHWLMGH